MPIEPYQTWKNIRDIRVRPITKAPNPHAEAGQEECLLDYFLLLGTSPVSSYVCDQLFQRQSSPDTCVNSLQGFTPPQLIGESNQSHVCMATGPSSFLINPYSSAALSFSHELVISGTPHMKAFPYR